MRSINAGNESPGQSRSRSSTRAWPASTIACKPRDIGASTERASSPACRPTAVRPIKCLSRTSNSTVQVKRSPICRSIASSTAARSGAAVRRESSAWSTCELLSRSGESALRPPVFEGRSGLVSVASCVSAWPISRARSASSTTRVTCTGASPGGPEIMPPSRCVRLTAEGMWIGGGGVKRLLGRSGSTFTSAPGLRTSSWETSLRIRSLIVIE